MYPLVIRDYGITNEMGISFLPYWLGFVVIFMDCTMVNHHFSPPFGRKYMFWFTFVQASYDATSKLVVGIRFLHLTNLFNELFLRGISFSGSAGESMITQSFTTYDRVSGWK